MQFWLLTLITQLRKIISQRWRPSCRTRIRSLSSQFCITFICLRFLSLWLPQIKSPRSKTSYSRRSESFHSRRNCNCATRNVSKCDAELWGETPDCVRQEVRHLSDIIFRNWVINVSNQNCIYYRLFWCWHNFFYIENEQSYNYLKNMRSFCATRY